MSAGDAERQKQAVRETFDNLAARYDNPATRFFPFCADRLVDFVKPRPGGKALDIATGTGAVALSLAQAVGSKGRVAAIDLSSAMLDKAEVNIRKMALSNIDLHEMDAEKLDFKSGYFHTVVCSYGLFFIPDMQAAVRDWARVLRPGGKLAFTSFEETAFCPMLDNFVENLQAFGVELPQGPFGSRRLTSLAHCGELLADAGLTDIELEVAQIGYHLKDEHAWWEVVTSTAMNSLFEQLPKPERDGFKQQHLEFVGSLKNSDGVWMDVQTRFAAGIKPAD